MGAEACLVVLGYEVYIKASLNVGSFVSGFFSLHVILRALHATVAHLYSVLCTAVH